MILRAYCIFDNKALHYHPPFFLPTDGAAVRALTDMVQDPNTSIGRHPGDFILYCIGTFDDHRAQMSPVDPLIHVIDAITLVRIEERLNFNREAAQ